MHHIDENKLNDSIENLQIMTKAEHMKFHSSNRTDETRKKLSEVWKDKKHTDEAKQKMSEAWKNRLDKHHTDETKKKMSANHANFKGTNNPRYIQATDEMSADIKNGIRFTDFIKKYAVSKTVWHRLQKETRLI